jgi:hypothetical protein
MYVHYTSDPKYQSFALWDCAALMNRIIAPYFTTLVMTFEIPNLVSSALGQVLPRWWSSLILCSGHNSYCCIQHHPMIPWNVLVVKVFSRTKMVWFIICLLRNPYAKMSWGLLFLPSILPSKHLHLSLHPSKCTPRRRAPHHPNFQMD